MSCCAGSLATAGSGESIPDPSAFVRHAPGGICELDLLVPGIHCAGCISRIEKALHAMPGVTHARVNMSSRRVAMAWREGEAEAGELAAAVAGLGYRVQPFDAALAGRDGTAAEERELLRALAVAGFAAANVMLLSVSVWSGAADATRDLFHWISALIALPAVVYAGRPFFRSALGALRSGGLNMDVPISLAVILAAGTSLFETFSHGEHAYFDASVTLLFFLLIGRYLDLRLRARAHSAVAELMALNAAGAMLVEGDGSRRYVPLGEVKPGALVAVAAGERVPVDGEVIEGSSDLDRSLVTGESVPEAVGPGAKIHAGCLNLSGPLVMRVSAAGEATFLSEVIRLMEAAEKGKARHVAIADRLAAIYAPAVHVLAAVTFLFWLWVSGGDWRQALLAATAVLIITCPCALALAVPVVQVVASGIAFRGGVMVKDGAGLEKLSEIDTVVFDKTGTLTLGRPEPVFDAPMDAEALAIAAGLARDSRHPLARAIVSAARLRGIEPEPVEDIREIAGSGLEGRFAGGAVRLGRADWVAQEASGQARGGLLEMWLARDGKAAQRFAFRDELRADARETIARLAALGFEIELLSGDREAAVAEAASQLGIKHYSSEVRPHDKVARLKQLRASQRRVLMVGDGINDAPALAEAHVSMSPGSAAAVASTQASFVFLGESLSPVADMADLSRRAMAIVRGNFALALAYNAVAVPVAMAGLASPLVAAIAMSSSSLLVTLNALRLRAHIGPQQPPAPLDDAEAGPGAARIGAAA